MKKTISLILAMVMMLSMLVGCGQTSPAPETDPGTESQTEAKSYSFKLATTVQTAMPAGRAAETFCNDVLAASDGRIAIEYVPASQLGGPEELMAQLVDGTLDIGQISLATASAYDELLEVVQLPFLLTDYDKVYKAYNSDELKAIFAEVEKNLNVKILCMAEHGVRVFANNVRPIASPADLKGLKLRIGANSALISAIENLGASPVSITYKELYSALDSSVIDGEEINFTSMYAETHYEVLDYITDLVLWPFPAVLIMSGKAWNSLDPADQEILTACSDKCLENNFEYLKEYEVEAKEAIKASGTEILEGVDPTPFQEGTAYLIDEYRAKNTLFSDFIAMCEGL